MAEENSPPSGDQDDSMLDMDEADEIVEQEEDAAMDSGEEELGDEEPSMEETLEEIQLQNDSVAHFDHHKDSVFCIAQHPTQPHLVATGAGDDVAYLWDSTPPEPPLLPRSYEADPASSGNQQHPQERESLAVLSSLAEQDESVNAIAFTLPRGDFIVTGSLAGKLNVYPTTAASAPNSAPQPCPLITSAKEVEEINWIAACPHPKYPDHIAFGASDGSVWVYSISSNSNDAPLTIVQSFFLHQAPCTAGAWTPDGKLLATVAEDSSLFVWDVFGEAAAAGISDSSGRGGGQAVVALTGADERFFVDGGLYSVAVSPGGGVVAVGGAEGNVRVVGLPRLSAPSTSGAPAAGKSGAGARSKAGGGKQAGGSAASGSAGQAGQLLASLQAQTDGVETLDFSQPPLTLLAAGSVDGSVVLFDASHNFAVRRSIPGAHEDEAVIRVEFVKRPLGTPNPLGHVLTTCGNDGVVRRWDVRGGSTANTTGKGLMGEWRGHRGGGEGGGILGFVQGGGGGARIVTAGDDGVSLVFDTASS